MGFIWGVPKDIGVNDDYIRVIYGNEINGPYQGSLLKSLDLQALKAEAPADDCWTREDCSTAHLLKV